MAFAAVNDKTVAKTIHRNERCQVGALRQLFGIGVGKTILGAKDEYGNGVYMLATY